MSSILDRLDPDEREAATAREPGFRQPMLATLVHETFSDPAWIYERKFDGERVIAVKNGASVSLWSRNEKDISATYPELVGALEAQSTDGFVIDGEVVAFDGAVTSFSRLQQRMKLTSAEEARNSPVAVYYYAFDLIDLDGRGLEEVPLRARKSLLRAALDFDNRIRYSAHRNETGEAMHREACEKGWEGVIAKRADSAYCHSRSRDWLKFKCAHGQELVIGGYTAPQGERSHFGALLVGYYDDRGLRYAGKVGTGYDHETLARVHSLMAKRERDTSPFVDPVTGKNVTWVTPELVGEFGFTEWTQDGKLRHPRFLGLRRDKPAKKVRREA